MDTIDNNMDTVDNNMVTIDNDMDTIDSDNDTNLHTFESCLLLRQLYLFKSTI